MFGHSVSRDDRDGGSRTRTGFGATSRLRGEVKPPSLRCEPSGGWQRLKFWFLAPSPLEASPPLNTLPAVRADFLAAMGDVSGPGCADLRQRIEHARSLRELWHLRASLFGHLARELSQGEAQVRVERLNVHFGGRAPRTLSGPLQP